MLKRIRQALARARAGIITAVATAAAAIAAFFGITSADAQATPIVDRLTWTAPTHFVDGSVIPAGTITGYRIVWGPTPEGTWPAANTLDTSNVLERTITRPETYGNRCYKMAALVGDANGLWTQAACKNVQAPPNPPGNLQVQ